MRIDGGLGGDLRKAAAAATVLEGQGYDGLWTAETSHDPFFPLLLASQTTTRAELGTGIAVAFARNPMNLAQLVVLKGPWSDPKLTLDAQGVAGVAASLGLAGATGGLSLLAQELLKANPEKDVCRTALSGMAPSPSTTAPAPATPASQPKAPLRLPQALPEALRNIFK